MINKMSKSKSRLVRCLTDGMMSSNILVMTTNYKKLSRKKLVIRSKNLSRSQKIRIGGEPSGMSSIWRISSLLMNNLKSSTESEVAKWPQRPLLPQITHTNWSTTTLCPCMRIPQASATSCPRNGNKWKSTKFLTVFWAAGSSGTRTTKTKKIRKNNCTTPGPVVLSNNEESLTLRLWKPSYQAIMSLITHRKSSYWVRKRRKSGKSCMRKTSLLILFRLHLTRWGTFRFTTGWSRRGSRGVWTCTCAPE